MVSISPRLWLAAVIGFFLTMWFVFLHPDPDAPLRPVLSPQQAENTAMHVLQTLQVKPESLGPWQVEQEENTSAEQYLAQQKSMADFQTRFGAEKPLVLWKVVSVIHKGAEIWVNQQTGRVEAVRGIPLGTDVTYLKKQFEHTLAPVSTSSLGNGRKVTAYKLNNGYKELQDVIEIETTNGVCTSFTHLQKAPDSFLVANKAPSWVEAVGSYFNLLTLLLFPFIGVYVFLFNSKKLVGLRWQVPVLVAGMTALAIVVQEGLAQGVVESLLYGLSVLVLMQLLYRGKFGRVRDFIQRNWMGQKVVLGYCLFAVQAGVSVLFGWVAERFGGWMSAAQGQELFAQSHWPLLLPIATGVAGAVFEELLYRKCADMWLRRFVRSTWGIGLFSSLLWSLGHLGYDVSPWYLRVIELGLVVGPLSFWMYRVYGMFPLLLAHFLYNVFVTCHDLVRTLGGIYGAVYLYLLLPVGLLVVLRLRKFRFNL